MGSKQTVTESAQVSWTAARRDGGFTLVELLVSMTIVGLLAVAILFGFRIGTNAWAKGETGLERVRTASAIFDLISRQLGSMVVYYSPQKLNEVPVDVLLFQGADTGMRFVSTFSLQSRGAGGLYLIEYFVTSSKDGNRDKKALVLNETSVPDDAMLGESVFDEVSMGKYNFAVATFREFSTRANSFYLIEDLDSVQFRYIKPEPPEDGSDPRVASTPISARYLLPQGIGFKLRWSEARLLASRELSVAIPIYASAWL